MGGHGLRDGEETGGERADAELLEVLARDDGLWRRRDFDAHAGPERRTQRKEGVDQSRHIGEFGETQAHFGMPLASKRDTSFLACWIVASVSYAAEGEVWACTRPVRYG